MRAGLVLFALTIARSSAPVGFVPITDEDVHALGITQGIAGKAALRSGDCMPGADTSRCLFGPLLADLWLIPGKNAVCLAGPTRCDVPSFTTAADLGGVSVDLASGRYGVSLPAGIYMPIIVEPGGTQTCLSGTIGQPQPCSLVVVTADTVLKFDVILNRAVE